MVQDGISAERIVVVHSATDVGRFERAGGEREGILKEFRLSEQTLLIGNVAACVGHKGQDYLLSAMPTVFSEFPNAVLFIVGDGPLRRELEASARGLKIGNRVIFTGVRDDVPRFLHAFDLFVLPSWGEGMGSVLLEAMAARKPVVATDAGGIVEVVRDCINGLLVPKRNAEALARGIGWMLRNGDAARAMGEAGRRTVEEWFTADRMVEGTLAVYDTLVRRNVS
jgi:glycosyltransferase involved in cell wall biosynthesis